MSTKIEPTLLEVYFSDNAVCYKCGTKKRSELSFFYALNVCACKGCLTDLVKRSLVQVRKHRVVKPVIKVKEK